MKRSFLFLTIILLVMSAACQTGTTIPAPQENGNLTATAANSPTAEPPPTDPPPTTPTGTEEAAAATTAPTGATLPASSVFDLDWDDRQPFRAGLISSEQAVLEELRGATVYHMALILEEGLNMVSGRLAARYTNQEDVPLDFIYFHLHPNLLGGAIDVSNVTVNKQAVTPVLESFNDSVMRVPLAELLAPGQQIVIGMDFLTTIPREPGPNYGIFVYTDEVLTLAHFYPMIAVYDADEWNIDPPDNDGDVTYSDTSFYLVQITAPPELVVVASGVKVPPTAVPTTETDEGQTMTSITYAAGPMRDFYTVMSERYTAVSQQVGETLVTSYAPAEFSEAAELALDTAATALQTYSKRFGIYPFTELDIASTPTLALGVEYPGVIVDAIRIYDFENNNSEIAYETVLESTTAHEVAHQWFYSLIGNDQLDEPWLDESITQYATNLYYLDRYGPEGGAGHTSALEQRWARVDKAEIPIGLPVAAYEGAEYGAIVYGRGPIFMQTLAETIGQETFATFMQDYFVQYQWGIATTAGFRTLAETHCQCDLQQIFDEWVYGDDR